MCCSATIIGHRYRIRADGELRFFPQSDVCGHLVIREAAVPACGSGTSRSQQCRVPGKRETQRLRDGALPGEPGRRCVRDRRAAL